MVVVAVARLCIHTMKQLRITLIFRNEKKMACFSTLSN